MTIQNSALLVGASVAASGGTSTNLVTKGLVNGAGHEVILDDNAEFINSTRITFSANDPKVKTGTPNGYTQARSRVVISSPVVLANGNSTVNTLRIELSVDHEVTDADIAEMLSRGAQLMTGSDFTGFWDSQITA